MVAVDPARKYGVQDPVKKSNFTCNFCSKLTTGGALRLKQHLVGGFKDVKKCVNCPDHVQVELREYMEHKQSLKAQQHMEQAQYRMHEPDEYDEEDEEDVVEIAGPSKGPL